MKSFLKVARQALVFSIGMVLVCGILYPLALTGVSQVLFPTQANGSLVEVDGKEVGSTLVGQDFQDERLFKCRPSAYNYNTYTQAEKDDGTYAGVASGSNNYAPSNPDLLTRVEEDIDAFLAANPDVKKEDIPMDIVTASGSGLDPHISVASANIQVAAIASASGLSEQELQTIIENHTTKKFLGVFGEETVNVLECNLEIAQKIGMI